MYDIFGYTDQTLQGADIIAFGETDHPFQVIMPDFWEGDPCDFALYPPDTPEKQAKLGEWFQKASPPIHLPKIAPILEAAKQSNSNISKWGVIGYCWGGKMASLLSQEGSPFKVAVQTSPALIDPSEGAKVTIPMMILASEDESKEEVSQYSDNLKVTKQIETFTGYGHGFMSARADLDNAFDKEGYTKGYHLANKFLHDHLS